MESLKKKVGPAWVVGLILLTLVITVACFILLNVEQKKLAVDKETLRGSGSLEAEEVTLGFKVPGKLDKIMVDEGMQVKQGQILAVLEKTEIEAKSNAASALVDVAGAKVSAAETYADLQTELSGREVDAATSILREAEAAMVAVEKAYQRTEALYQEGAVSQQSLDELKAKYISAQEKVAQAKEKLAIAQASEKQVLLREKDVDAARAALRQAESSYQESQAYLNNTVLKSPINGLVNLRTVDVGEMVNAGTPVFTITDLSRVWVKIYIDEKKIGRVFNGQAAKVYFDAFPGKSFAGQVVYISQAGEFATRKAVNEQRDHDIKSFAVKVSVDNSEKLLKNGMTAYVELITNNEGKR
jgi:HlyD family secretion protein